MAGRRTWGVRGCSQSTESAGPGSSVNRCVPRCGRVILESLHLRSMSLRCSLNWSSLEAEHAVRIVGEISVNGLNHALPSASSHSTKPDNLNVLPNDHRDLTHLRRTCQPDWRHRFTLAMANGASTLEVRVIRGNEFFQELWGVPPVIRALVRSPGLEQDAGAIHTTLKFAPSLRGYGACPAIPLVYAVCRVEYAATGR